MNYKVNELLSTSHVIDSGSRPEANAAFQKRLNIVGSHLRSVACETQAIGTLLRHYRDDGSFKEDDLSGLGDILIKHYRKLDAVWEHIDALLVGRAEATDLEHQGNE